MSRVKYVGTGGYLVVHTIPDPMSVSGDTNLDDPTHYCTQIRTGTQAHTRHPRIHADRARS
jgi:hypothetical protein